ncbi:RNA-directed DNA polymerase [Sulfitobacter sp. 1A10445]|uniref:RNA-directed DNA polymerase n=1 Tax=unclassified Sulfitobacter TaxID=196795 RepID=UPI0037451CE7
MDIEFKSMLFSTGQVFGFPVDLKVVTLQLQQDMRDDWYRDALGYTDIFSDHEYVADVVFNCLNTWGGQYYGDHRTVRPIPKKKHAERYSLETDVFDRFVYQAVCTFLAPNLDSALSHRVLSYRVNRGAEDTKYLFRNKISKWLDYEGLTYRFVANKGALAATDVSNFFENVSAKQVISALHMAVERVVASGYRKGQMLSAVRLLERLFERWTLNGEFGLPQNRDCSSFLSNVLLSQVDFEMQKRGYDYYRYVDDIRIVCGDEHEARRSLQVLISLLRDVGMNINSTKTDVLSYDSPISLISEHFPSQNELVLAIESMWKSRSRRVFIRSIEYIIAILREALETGDTQSRTFRFAVNRISQLIEAKLLDVESDDSKALLKYALSTLSDDAVSSDQLCKLILVLEPEPEVLSRIEIFLLARETCIHDWQNHKLWLLLAELRFKGDGLKELAKTILAEDPSTGEAAGVMIWLQSVGYLDPVEGLIDTYTDSWPFQNQRYFLIAMGAMPADKLNKLNGKVPEKLIGTTNRSKKAFREDGVAISKREKPSFKALYEDIKDYS